MIGISRMPGDRLCENLGVIVRVAAANDAIAIASFLNAFLATTTIGMDRHASKHGKRPGLAE
jgi:hypothetical protein